MVKMGTFRDSPEDLGKPSSPNLPSPHMPEWSSLESEFDGHLPILEICVRHLAAVCIQVLQITLPLHPLGKYSSFGLPRRSPTHLGSRPPVPQQRTSMIGVWTKR